MKQGLSLNRALIKLHKLVMLDKKDVGTVYFFAILGGIISLSLPLGIQTIMNFVLAASFSTSIVVLISLVLAGVFVNGLVQVRQMQEIEKIRQKIYARYSLEFSYKIPRIDLEKMDGYYLPQMANYYFDVASLTKSIEKILLDIPAALIQILLGLILLSFYHPIFIAFGALVVTVLVIILRITSRRGFETSMEASDYKYKIAGWLQEVASTVKSFKYSKGTDIHVQKSDKLISGYLQSRTQHFRILMVQYWSFISFKILIVAAMLIVGTYLLIQQQMTIGQFIASDIVIILIINSVEKLIVGMDKVYDSLTSIEKLSQVIDRENETGGSLHPSASQGFAVSFQNVRFVYPNGSEAFGNLSFEVPATKIAAITGHAGSGRSSILRLLTGAYKGFTGIININEIPIGNYNIEQLRLCTGIMLNQQDIFNATILHNITMGNKNIRLEEITMLAEKIGFTEFVNNTQLGYDTPLDPIAKKLHSHIRQNILLLRALVGKPRLLLLEDPVKHLTITQKLNILYYLKHESRATILLITDDEEAIAQSDLKINLSQRVK